MTLRRIPVGRLEACARAGVALLLAFLAVPAAAAEFLEVRGVKVDVTADSAAAARQKAHAEGEVKAFEMLLARIVRGADRGRLPRLSAGEVSALVADFSVAEEKTSAVRYVATLDFRFRGERVRDLLESYGVAMAATPPPPLVVVPVLRTAAGTVLWDDPNPWRQAWERRSGGDGIVPIVVPPGDLADIASIDPERAMRGDARSLNALTQRYTAADALVAVAELRTDAASGAASVAVTYTRYEGGRAVFQGAKTIAGKRTDGVADLLAQAVAAVDADLQERGRDGLEVPQGQAAVAAVAIPVTQLNDWLAVRSRLERLPAVRRVELVQLSREWVRINLYYLGSVEELASALQQAELSLRREADVWILQPAPVGEPRRT
jgi:hypothetical protein